MFTLQNCRWKNQKTECSKCFKNLNFFAVLPCDEGSRQGAGGANPGDEIPNQQVHQAEGKFPTNK